MRTAREDWAAVEGHGRPCDDPDEVRRDWERVAVALIRWNSAERRGERPSALDGWAPDAFSALTTPLRG